MLSGPEVAFTREDRHDGMGAAGNHALLLREDRFALAQLNLVDQRDRVVIRRLKNGCAASRYSLAWSASLQEFAVSVSRLVRLQSEATPAC